MMSSSTDEDSFDLCSDIEDDGTRNHEAIGQKDNTASRNTSSQFPPTADNAIAGCSDLQQLKNEKDNLLQKLFELENILKRKEQGQTAKKRTLKRIKEKIERDKEENQKQFTSQHEKEQGLLQEIQSFENQCQDYQKRIHELENQQEQSNNVHTELLGKLQQAEGTILALANDKNSLEEEMKREKKIVEEFQKQSASQHETEKGMLQQIQSQCQAYQKRNHELVNQQKQSNHVQTELECKLQQAEGTILSLKKDIISLVEERLLHREKKTVEEFQKQSASQHETEKGMLQQNQKLSYYEDQCRVYQKKIHALKKQQEHSSNFQTELEGKLQQAEGMFLALKKDKSSLEEEKEHLLHRLSQLAGAKLTLDNPNIADLSDTKRPTKLAEEFAELYDNEWTDAFEDVKILNEQMKTTFMLKLLQRTNEICRDVSNAHMDGLKKGLCTLTVRSNDITGRSSNIIPEQKVNIALDCKEKETEEMIKAKRSRRNSQLEHTETRGPSMEHEVTCDFDVLQPDQKKSLIELRKCIEINLSKDLEEVVTDVIAKERDFDKETQSAVFKYVAKCVNICWSMCRVEPPVYINFTEVQGDFSLDTNVYKSYTKTGKFIDYIVWPAVYLHENGPLLCKGVAQGRT